MQATVLDRQTDSLTFIVSVRPEIRGNIVDPAHVKMFMHFPRALMQDGNILPLYAPLAEELKTAVLESIGYKHIAQFGLRLSAAGVRTTIPAKSLLLAPQISATRRRAKPPSTASARTVPSARTTPSTPSARAAPSTPSAPAMPFASATTHRTRPRAHLTCRACALVPDLDTLVKQNEKSLERIEAAGKIAIRYRNKTLQPSCPHVFAELGLEQHIEKQVLAVLRGLEEENLYPALVAIGLCPLHACRLVETAITDQTAGFKIRSFR